MSPVLWLITGVLLILSELLATGVIAVFMGLGAIMTALFLQLGWIESAMAQVLLFSGVSLVTLLLARNKLKDIFLGKSLRLGEPSAVVQQAIGQRVTVVTRFEQGAGRVLLNGVQWNAFSEDALDEGDIAWVVRNSGIELHVSKTKPATSI